MVNSMSLSNDTPNLTRILALLVESPVETHRKLIVDTINELTEKEWLLLAAWDVSACYGQISGTLFLSVPNHIQVNDAYGNRQFLAELVPEDKSKDRVSLIRLVRTKWIIVLDSASVPFEPGDIEH